MQINTQNELTSVRWLRVCVITISYLRIHKNHSENIKFGNKFI